MRRAMLLLSALCLAPVAACGGGGDDGPAGDDEHYDCALEDRADDFVVGLEKVSEAGTHFRIMQSVPAPPARGDNVLTLQVADSADAPVAGAELEVMPFMPDHGHGTPVEVIVTESTTVVGEYTLDPVNLWMPGLWQLIVNRGSEQVTFAFCIPG